VPVVYYSRNDRKEGAHLVEHYAILVQEEGSLTNCDSSPDRVDADGLAHVPLA
jgi:hypothetical protein